MDQRDYSIDWLRVLGMFGIFSFHVARFFNDEDWHVKNLLLSEGASIYVGILNQFIMPLFFVLSAIATCYALKRWDGNRFIRERFNRLIVPLIFGILVLVPHQVYIERLTHGDFTGNLWQFMPTYFQGWYGFGGNFAWMGLHLWYLLMLFLFSLLLLPALLSWKSEVWEARFTRWAHTASRPLWLFLLWIPLGLMEALVNQFSGTVGRRDFGGWSPLSYLVIFLLGYWLATDPRYRETAKRWRFAFLAAGLSFTFVGYLMVEAGLSQTSLAFSLLRGVNTWSWLLAFLGLAGFYLNGTNAFLKYANAAVLPFYILHQSVIVLVAFYLRELEMSVIAKYVLLALISFAIIMLLYEGLIRRVKTLHPLFGMKA